MMASIVLSRVIGFFREMILARSVGATEMTDVYYASFTIPDFINYLMAAGALSISFIPILAPYLKADQAQGQKVFRAAASWMGLVIVILIAMAEWMAPNLTAFIAPGFNAEQSKLLTQLLRIILPAQFFFYWGGLAIAVQQTHGKFLFSALAPIVYNLGIIVFGLLLHQTHGVLGFSIGVTVGCFFSHGVLQWWGLKQLGYSAIPLFSLDSEVWKAIRRYLWLSLPISLGFSLVVTDEWITKYFASMLEPRAISWLSYARTEMRIPVAIVGQAAGIASFPYLSRLWAEKDFGTYHQTLIRELQKLWALAPLASVLLIVHSLPITQFVYGGGKLSSADLFQTSQTVKVFGFGVFFWTAQILLARVFYSAQKTWLPSLIGSLISVLVIPLYSILSKEHAHLGLALAGTLGIILYCVVLWGLLVPHLKRHDAGMSFGGFYGFALRWVGLILIAVVISVGIRTVFESNESSSRLLSFLEITLSSSIIGGLALWSLRKYFVRWTGTPLY